MRNKLILLLILPLLAMLTGCSQHSDTPGLDPTKAALTFPAQDALCTTGTVLSATQSSVTFTWTASANTDSYELDIINLLTGVVSKQTATTNTLAVTILRNTPYAWFVVSKSNTTIGTEQSDIWKFYNSGPGTVSHSPFPAEAVSPAFGHNVDATGGTINLSWTGSDVDGDIAGYDVYFGSTTMFLLKSNVTDMFTNNVTVTPGTTYYWKVVTKDVQGNTSESNTFQFKVN